MGSSSSRCYQFSKIDDALENSAGEAGFKILDCFEDFDFSKIESSSFMTDKSSGLIRESGRLEDEDMSSEGCFCLSSSSMDLPLVDDFDFLDFLVLTSKELMLTPTCWSFRDGIACTSVDPTRTIV